MDEDARNGKEAGVKLIEEKAKETARANWWRLIATLLAFMVVFGSGPAVFYALQANDYADQFHKAADEARVNQVVSKERNEAILRLVTRLDDCLVPSDSNAHPPVVHPCSDASSARNAFFIGGVNDIRNDVRAILELEKQQSQGR